MLRRCCGVSLWLAGWSVLACALLVGCASKGSVCVEWDIAVAEEVDDLHDVGAE